MLGPVARSRVSLAGAVLLTAAAGAAVLAAESSPVAGPAGLATPLRVVYGPAVPAPPAVQPAARLLLADGALLAPAHAPELATVAVAPAAPAAPPAAAATSPVVGPGSPAEDVREVQRLLNAAGAGLAVDGQWGPATERAVRRAQSQAGLPVDGRVGPATAAALRARD